MANTPAEEKPSIEHDGNELPENDQDLENTLEDEPLPEDNETPALDDAQKQAAEERKEGGYQ